MRIRNKKTGKIVELECITLFEPECQDIWQSFDELNSVSELNENWEDYEPKEPLIKDGEIRKAVRAWAKANRTSKFEYDGLYGITDETVNEIEFGSSAPFAELEDDRYYTIEELCGEEE